MAITKIGFFVPFYPYIKGGAEYQARIIANELQKKGVVVFFIAVNSDLTQEITQDGYKVYFLKTQDTLFNKITLYKPLMDSVRRIIAEEKPNVMYQRILNTFSYRLGHILKKKRIPYVLHIADNYSVEFTDGLQSKLKKKLLLSLLEKDPKIICQTQYQQQQLALLQYSNSIIVNNIHPKIRTKIGVKVPTRIVWVGNVRPVKQLEVYLELAKSLQTTNLVFNVIGKIPQDDDYGKMLMQKISNQNNVTYLGVKENTYINEFLSTSMVLVNTSLSEGFSNTFIQAWMSGTQVLSYNSDPNGIITAKKHLGKVCDGNIKLLQQHLTHMVTDKDYKVTSSQCQIIANELFSVESNFDKIWEILINDLKNE